MKLQRHLLTFTTLAMLTGLPIGSQAQSAVDIQQDDSAPLALVYRGPAGCEGCSEAVAEVLKTSKYHFRIQYVGPNEKLKITEDNLAKAALYAQPGGGDDEVSASYSIGNASLVAVQNYVRNGGHYLGVCMGAYLAGDVGFGLVNAKVYSEVDRPDSLVHNSADTVTPVIWRGKKRWMYFQDGAALPADPQGSSPLVLARYPNNDIAAAIYNFGEGTVGLVGPHPEADQEWYKREDLENPDGVNQDLAYDLISATMRKNGTDLFNPANSN